MYFSHFIQKRLVNRSCVLGSRCSQSAGIAAGAEEAVGPGWAHPEGRKKTGHSVLGGLVGLLTAVLRILNQKILAERRAWLKLFKNAGACRAFLEAWKLQNTKHISLLVLPASQPWGSRSRLLSGSQVPAPVCPQGQQVQQCRVEGTRWGCARRSSLHASVLQHSVKTLSVEVAADGFCQAMEPRSWCARGERVGEKANKTQRQCFSSYLFLRFICCHILGFSLFIWINVSDEVYKSTYFLELQVR